MVPIPDAVRNAIVFAQQTLGAERTARLQLEEVESGGFNGKGAWLITLSMPAADIAYAIGGRRDYKLFTVLKENGEVVSMKIRELVRPNA